MLYSYHSDETLVLLTLAGEQDAYEALVIRHQKAVMASAMTVTRSHFMAEDAAQDAFVTAWMKLNTLQQPDSFGAWVCRIAKNCALNMITRYRSFLTDEPIEDTRFLCGSGEDPAELYALSENREEVRQSIGKLPAKVGTIIRLHYFEGLSIAEIADRMRISEGTVKWQLHDGRKRMRKELCAMNEKYGDTLVRRVMKKVEELKLWQVKNDKSGFETVYQNVLRDVEELPECGDKYHALADVLMRGWWWLPGDKNDALFARIRDAAMRGGNDEVMEFIVTREDARVYGGAKIEFIRDKQIPLLEKAGLVGTLGREWFWLGYQYFREGQPEKGKEAYDKVASLLSPRHRYAALVPGARAVEETLSEAYRDTDERKYRIGCNADELRYIDGALRYWKSDSHGMGYMNSVDYMISYIFHTASLCDGRFFDESRKVGESVVGTDGTTLTFAAENETVETPAGTFEGCQLWITASNDTFYGRIISKNWYQRGIGIVRHERTVDGFTDVRLLESYRIVGGDGLLPMAAGNTWAYSDTYDPTVMTSSLCFTVTYADEKAVIVASQYKIERRRYDENCWLDMIEEIRNEYCTWDNPQKICDVSRIVERAEALAKTPMEKAHTKAAASVIRRIMATDPVFNPDHTATGHWNFFSRNTVHRKNGALSFSNNYRWSFEWKNTGGIGEADTPLLYNDIYSILQDAANGIWSEEWHVGASPLVEYMKWGETPIKTQIVCEDGGTVTTKAGTFENCLKLSLDIDGMKDGISYRGGKKEYVFAPGIGIIRTVNEYSGGARKAVYELSAYEGTGEGYMPMADGLMRQYEALDLTDGFVGGVVYTYVQDDEGETVIFKDAVGIRNLPPPITCYSAIQDEVIEEELWNAGKRNESRLRHDINNFHLLCHFLGRPSRYWAAPEKAVVWNKYRLKILEGLGDGSVPVAWLGHYASTSFRTACALFGCGKKEEGYEWLKKAFEAYSSWNAILDEAEMEVGDPLIYGGVKVIKGKGFIKLPDDTIEPITYPHLFNERSDLMYYGMTAPRGWEWFNPVRNEERFLAYVERARQLSEGTK